MRSVLDMVLSKTVKGSGRCSVKVDNVTFKGLPIDVEATDEGVSAAAADTTDVSWGARETTKAGKTVSRSGKVKGVDAAEIMDAHTEAALPEREDAAA